MLNPNNARAYSALKPAVSSRFHNELFEADAVHLLSNNEDYLARCVIHNFNADALASYFHALVEQVEAAAFYDVLNFFHSPHLGAHLSIDISYNAMVYGRGDPKIHAAYGLRPQQVRITVGLEDQEVLLARCEEALGKMTKEVA
jgi:cystathionine gamma-synthase